MRINLRALRQAGSWPLAAGDPAADGPDAEAEQFGGLVGADQL